MNRTDHVITKNPDEKRTWECLASSSLETEALPFMVVASGDLALIKKLEIWKWDIENKKQGQNVGSQNKERKMCGRLFVVYVARLIQRREQTVKFTLQIRGFSTGFGTLQRHCIATTHIIIIFKLTLKITEIR